MAREPYGVDISNLPDVERLAEEVRATHIPRILRRGDEVIAKIVPVAPIPATPHSSRHGRKKTEADMEAFRSSAGGWKGTVDTEKLKADIAESRRTSSRPPVKL